MMLQFNSIHSKQNTLCYTFIRNPNNKAAQEKRKWSESNNSNKIDYGILFRDYAFK